MTIRYTKTTRETGVDGHFYPGMDRVTVTPDEFPESVIKFPEDDGFWGEFEYVLDRVLLAYNGAPAAGVPACLSQYTTVAECAEAVHNDWPSDLMLLAAKDAVNAGAWLQPDTPSNFTDAVVLLNYLLGLAAWRVSANSFCAKWHFLMPRPEEVAAAAIRGDLDAPDRIHTKLRMHPNYQHIADIPAGFTRFPEGCPGHPSLNAMHAAAGGAEATIIKIVKNLMAFERGEVDLSAHCVAFWRTDAGVHYPQDNILGLWLGQETVNRFIQPLLIDIGFSAAQVSAAVAHAQTDWLAYVDSAA